MKELIQGKKRLHFFQNEKVVNDAISNFETVFPEENVYVVLSKDGNAPLVKEHNNTIFLSYRSPQLKWLLLNCYSFDEIICHSLWTNLDRLICKLDHPNITWVIWGGDLFEDVLYRNGYQLYFNENQLNRVRTQGMPVCIYKLLVGIRGRFNYYYRMRAIRRLNNICCTAPKDFDLLASFVKLPKKYNRKELLYYPIEKILDEQTQKSFVSGSDIWVNNAAGYNGNHIEVFHRIEGFKEGRMIHVPLGYGIKKYATFVEEEGRKILGDSFDPMMSFIPREEYYSKFLSSNSFIFGHLRGCATGNVVVALYLGAKVFLFKQNVLYDYFKNKGTTVFSIEDDLNEKNFNTFLSEDIRKKNREIVLEQFSYNNILSIIKNNF